MLTGCGWCKQVVGGVNKSWVVCTSRGWCKQVVGGVNKSWVVSTIRGGVNKWWGSKQSWGV